MVHARILVVEDDADCRELVESLLSSAGYDVIGAKTAVDALCVVERVRPDLVILDLMLPDVSGHEVARHLANDWRAFDVPIIVLSALADEGHKMVARFSGVYDYLEKPFSCSQLLHRVRTRLSEATHRSGRWYFKEARP